MQYERAYESQNGENRCDPDVFDQPDGFRYPKVGHRFGHVHTQRAAPHVHHQSGSSSLDAPRDVPDCQRALGACSGAGRSYRIRSRAGLEPVDQLPCSTPCRLCKSFDRLQTRHLAFELYIALFSLLELRRRLDRKLFDPPQLTVDGIGVGSHLLGQGVQRVKPFLYLPTHIFEVAEWAKPRLDCPKSLLHGRAVVESGARGFLHPR